MIDPAIQRRRITRLLIVAAVLVFLCGGFFALYQLNRNEQVGISDEQVLEQARQAFETQDYEAVLDLLESRTGNTTISAIQSDAELLQIYITARQEIPLFDLGHLARIVSPLTLLLDLKPDDLDSARLLVQTLLSLDREEEALESAQSFVKQHPTDTVLLRHLAEAQERTGSHEAALETLNLAIGIDPLHVPTYAQMLDLIESHDLPLASFVQQAEQVYKDHREDPQALMIRAMAYKVDGNGVQARAFFKQASELPPTRPSMTMMLMGLLDQEGMYAEATRYIMQHAEQGIQTPAGRMAIYRAFESGDDQAILDRLKDSTPDQANTDLLGMWVSAHQHTGTLDKAKPLLEALKQRDNEIAKTWVKLIEIDQLDNPNPALVIDAIVSVLQADDSPGAQAFALRHPYFMQRLGEAYVLALEPEAAYGAFAVAANNSDSWHRPHLSLAKTLLKLNQFNAAAIQANEANLRANSPESREWLVVTMAAAVDPSDEEAIGRLMAEASKLPAESSEAKRVLPSLVDTLVLAGRADEAKQRITESLSQSDTFDTETLESLLRRSLVHDLGLEQAIEEKIVELHGMTPGLALIKASLAASTGSYQQGLSILESAMPNPPTKPWQKVRADYLLNQNAPGAAESLIELAGQYPDDIRLQLAALTASEPASQSQVIDPLIDRLRSLAGESSINWRIQKARFSLNDSPDEKTLKSFIELLTEAQAYTPVHVGLRLLLARCYMMLGDDTSALQWTQAAKTISPQNHEAMLLNGMALHRLDRYQASRLDLIPVASSPEVEPQKRWQACIMLNEQGETTAVRNAILQMWTRGLANNQMLTILAQIYSSEGQFAKADEVCQVLINIPELETLRFVTNYYHQTNRPELAKQAVQAAVATGIDQADLMVLRAEDEAQRGQADTALKLIEDAANMQPDRASRWRDAARLALSLAKPNDAVRLANLGLAQVGSDPGLTSLTKQASLIQQIANDPTLIPMAVNILDLNEGHEQSIQALQIIRDQSSSEAVADALAKLAQSNPNIRYLSELACERMLQAGQVDKAFELARQTMGRFPKSANSARVATLAAYRLQDWQMLLSCAEAWAQRNPSDLSKADLMRAAAMNQLKRFTAATNTLKPYVQAESTIDDENQLLFDNYTTALVKSANPAEALGLLRPHLSTSRQARTLALKLAGLELQKAQTVATWIKEVSANSSSDAQERFPIMKSTFIAGQRLNDDELVRQAQQNLSVLMQTPGPLKLDLLYAKGQIAQHLGQYDQAEASYREVLASVPNNHLLLNNLALVLVERGEDAVNEAEQLAKQATTLVDNDPNLFDTLAIVYLRKGQLNKALAAIEKAIKLDQLSPAWRLTQADILEAMGDDQRATTIRERYAPKAQN